MDNHNAKHFVLQLGSLASLYLSLSFLLVLLFSIINLAMPDAADGVWQINNAKQSIKLGIAMTMVFFPTYLILTRIVNKNRRLSTGHSYLGLTKWLIYLSILAAGAVLLGDLVAVIMAYLNGDITVRFILKALSLLLVIGSAFAYYLLDARGYWLSREKESKLCALGASVLVIITLAVGFMNADTPAKAREIKIDDQQVRDLQQIQSLLQSYILANDELPVSLDDMEAVNLPTAPAERAPYEYRQIETGFELCATFAESSVDNGYYDEYYSYPTVIDEKSKSIIGRDNWQYKAGRHCFERVVR